MNPIVIEGYNMNFIKIINKRVLQHIVFWGISLYILLMHFQASSQISPTDFIYTGLFSIFIFVSVYINLFLLIPRFFQRGLYFQYAIYLVASLGILGYLQIFLFDYLVEWLFPGYYLISYFNYWQTLEYFIIFVGITTLLHLSKSWFLLKDSEAKLVKTQKEKVEAELMALKNQINPHFLFNSLNSIYSLVLKKNENAPEALIKLSDSMRYIIYESDNEKVELKKEIDFVTNYIELQKLRISEKDTINFTMPDEIGAQMIAPLLFIPIVENCFKHGIKGETASSFVDIGIYINDGSIALSTKNNIGMVDSVERSKSSGTGLGNLKQRL
ncbi:MAG: sensor histidine kinase, partial [Bacteroidota bacterium]